MFLQQIQIFFPEIWKWSWYSVKLSWANRYLLHINYKLFCFYCKFEFCFHEFWRVMGGVDNNNATQAQLSLAELTSTYYIIIINFFVFTTNSYFASLWIWGWYWYSKNKATTSQLSIIRFLRLGHKIYNPKFDQNLLQIEWDISS